MSESSKKTNFQKQVEVSVDSDRESTDDELEMATFVSTDHYTPGEGKGEGERERGRGEGKGRKREGGREGAKGGKGRGKREGKGRKREGGRKGGSMYERYSNLHLRIYTQHLL